MGVKNGTHCHCNSPPLLFFAKKVLSCYGWHMSKKKNPESTPARVRSNAVAKAALKSNGYASEEVSES